MGSRVHTNGLPYSAVERVQLSKAWLEESENAVVGTDQRRKEFFFGVAAKFQARMDRHGVPVRRGGMGLRVMRPVHGVQRYFGKLAKKVMQLVCARTFIESLQLTGNPSERDMELAMMARFERRDHYAAISKGHYEAHPRLTKPQIKAVYCLDCWRTLRGSDKLSGAAAAAAMASRPGGTAARALMAAAGAAAAREGGEVAAADAAGVAASEAADTDTVVDVDGLSHALGKRKKPASFRDRPLGTQSTLSRNALEAAMHKETVVGTASMKAITEAITDRALTAALSAPAIRDIPRFRDFLAQRADQMIAAHLAAAGRESAASAGGAEVSASAAVTSGAAAGAGVGATTAAASAKPRSAEGGAAGE